MPNYKLTSFKGRGRAEVAREMLFLHNVKYDEERLPMDHWPTHRPGTPCEKIPELEVDGKKLGQPYAIYRYLAHELGFDGSNAFESALIDSLAEQHRMYEDEMDSLMAVLFGFAPGDREEMIHQIGVPARDKYFPILEDIAKYQNRKDSADHAAFLQVLSKAFASPIYWSGDFAEKHGRSGHFIGCALTWVDLLIAEHVSVIEQLIPGFLSDYPFVRKTVKKILDTPKLQEWAKHRSETHHESGALPMKAGPSHAIPTM